MKKMVPVWPWPMKPGVAKVLEAIEGIQLVEALPGGSLPVLAVGKVPPFASDAIVVLSPEKATQAVDIITRNGIEMVTVRDWINQTTDWDVPFEATEKIESKVKFR